MKKLLKYYELCMRDACIAELSPNGRFNAARDATVASALIRLASVEGIQEQRHEEVLFALCRQKGIGPRLSEELRQLVFDMVDYTAGRKLPDDFAASRAYQCARKIHSTTMSWMRHQAHRGNE